MKDRAGPHPLKNRVPRIDCRIVRKIVSLTLRIHAGHRHEMSLSRGFFLAVDRYKRSRKRSGYTCADIIPFHETQARLLNEFPNMFPTQIYPPIFNFRLRLFAEARVRHSIHQSKSSEWTSLDANPSNAPSSVVQRIDTVGNFTLVHKARGDTPIGTALNFTGQLSDNGVDLSQLLSTYFDTQ